VCQRVRHVLEVESCGAAESRGGEPGAMYFLTRIKPELGADVLGATTKRGLADRASP